MASWAALNTSNALQLSNNTSSATEEAKDAENTEKYQHALRLQQLKKYEEAKDIYLQLLQERESLNTNLQYLCNANLATLETEKNNNDTAIIHFSNALALDGTDVVLWHQLGNAAVATGQLWLARHALEQGAKIDPKYWPLMHLLANVLQHIKDQDAFDHLFNYLKESDPYFQVWSECNQRKRKLNQIEMVSQNRSRKKLLQEKEMIQQLQAVASVKQSSLSYSLTHCSWVSLGKLLLEIYEEVVMKYETPAKSPNIIITLSPECAYGLQKDEISEGTIPKSEHPTENLTSGTHEYVNLSEDNSVKKSGTTESKSTVKTSHEDVILSNRSHLREEAPTRRKSRRHEEKLREEHEAAEKLARKEDLECRLQPFIRFIQNEVMEDMEVALEDHNDILKHLPAIQTSFRLQVQGTEFVIFDNESEVERVPMFPKTTFNQFNWPLTQSKTENETEAAFQPTMQSDKSRTAKSLSSNWINDFITTISGQKSHSSTNILYWLQCFLDKSGEWYNYILSDAHEDLHQVIMWACQLLSRGIHFTNAIQSTNVKQNSVIRLHREFGGEKYPLNTITHLFISELYVDNLLLQQKRSIGFKVDKQIHQILQLVDEAQHILLKLCLSSESSESWSTVRVLWLLAHLHELMNQNVNGEGFYTQCLECIEKVSNDDSQIMYDTPAELVKSSIVYLPNLRSIDQISKDSVHEKLSALQYPKLFNSACSKLENDDFDGAASILLDYFFPSHSVPRMRKLLSEVAMNVTSNSTDAAMKMLKEFDSNLKSGSDMTGLNILIFAMSRSTIYSTADLYLFLITMLYYYTQRITSESGQDYSHHSSKLQPNNSIFDYSTIVHAIETIIYRLVRLPSKDASCDGMKTRYKRLLYIVCKLCISPSFIKHFANPSKTLVSVLNLLDNFNESRKNLINMVVHLFASLQNSKLPNSDVLKLGDPKVLEINLLRLLNRFILLEQKENIQKSSIDHSVASTIMTECVKLMKNEETLLQSDHSREKTTDRIQSAKQLYGNAAILFALLFSSSTCSNTRGSSDSIQIVELIIFFHERMERYGICATPLHFSYITTKIEFPVQSKHSCSFVDIAVRILAEVANNKPRLTINQSTYNKLSNELAQCFCCLYDIHIIPGLMDHKTGITYGQMTGFSELKSNKKEKRDPTADSNDGNEVEIEALQLQNMQQLGKFAIPMLLEETPSSLSRKRENRKLLLEIHRVLQLSQNGFLDHTTNSIIPDRARYLEAKALLGTHDLVSSFLLTTDILSAGTESSHDPESWKTNIYFLLGENFIPNRIRGRSNLNDLIEMENEIKERIKHLLIDVSTLYPRRTKSWIGLGDAAQELYHAVTDACALLIGQKRKNSALREYADDFLNENHSISFHDIVLSPVSIFATIKEWNEKDMAVKDDFRVKIFPHEKNQDVNQLSLATDMEKFHEFTIEAFIVHHMVRLVEFSRRCFAMATALAAQDLKALDQQFDNNISTDIQNKKEILRTTMVTCSEECGLLLYNLLQEFSVLRNSFYVRVVEKLPCKLPNTSEESLIPFTLYVRIVDQALVHFSDALNYSGDLDDNEAEQFRLNFIIGKVRKKKMWCELKVKQTITLAEAGAEQAMENFAKAEAAKINGDLDSSFLQAFFALQSIRMRILMEEPVKVKNLQIVWTHYFENDDNLPSKPPADAATPTRITNPELLEKSSIQTHIESLTVSDLPVQKQTELLYLVRGWLFLNVVSALEWITTEDRYFHPCRYVLASAMLYLPKLANIPEVLHNRSDAVLNLSQMLIQKQALQVNKASSVSQVSLDSKDGKISACKRDGDIANTHEAQPCRESIVQAIGELNPLFDKKRPQIVAIWLSDVAPDATKFEELNQRQVKFDRYRHKYWRLYVQLLANNDMYGRLKEIARWAVSCREDHDVIGEMILEVFSARLYVLLTRFRKFQAQMLATSTEKSLGGILNPTAPAVITDQVHLQTLQKLNAKIFTLYIDLTNLHNRFVDFKAIKTIVEQLIVLLYIMGGDIKGEERETMATNMRLDDMITSLSIVSRKLHEFKTLGSEFDVSGLDNWSEALEKAISYCKNRWPERAPQSYTQNYGKSVNRKTKLAEPTASK